MKTSLLLVPIAFAMGSRSVLAQQAPPTKANPDLREWTSSGGKKQTAEYLGVQGDKVMLKFNGGKVTPVPIDKLSPADRSFIEENSFGYFEPWNGWPADAEATMRTIEVQELKVPDGSRQTFTYTTTHFRFHTDANLGANLMRDLARVFELTYQLHSHSPFGILARPEDKLFNANLLGTQSAYRYAGGPPQSAGVYLPSEKVFLAPLELMGVRAGSGIAGWSKDHDYDPSTVVHELTHMLTHDMLAFLPIWVNEGYAEYIEHIPIEGNAFKVSREKIRQGTLEAVLEHNRSVGDLLRAREILSMTDEQWNPGKSTPFDNKGAVRMAKLYRTSHLIIYYFIELEGANGVEKIRHLLNVNQKQFLREKAMRDQFADELKKYEESFKAYEEAFIQYKKEMAAFANQPGVIMLPDGRVRYPANLTPPLAPARPAPPPVPIGKVKSAGMDALLGGESAEIVGARIETALQADLRDKLKGSELRFAD